ncbi:MAG: cation:proton antiporter, partial [Desulfohalobiaceae bacterium]
MTKAREKNRLYRSRRGIFLGVCRGIAEHFGFSVFWFRALVVIAVLVTTLLVAGGLVSLTPLPLLWALALGAIVATTDPSAVLAVFKQVGAPRRLQALVEGESLLNDAAAIVLFAAVVELLGGQAQADPAKVALEFALTFLGGGLLGAAVGLAAGLVIARLPGVPEAAVTLSVAVPYATFLFAELSMGIS